MLRSASLNRRRRCLFSHLASVALILGMVGASNAWGQVAGREPFSLRFPAALARFSPYADVAGVGGASVASKWASSVNPAAIGWLDWSTGRNVEACSQYSTVGFEEGTRLHIASAAAGVNLGERGRLQPAFARAWSNEATTRQDLEFDFDLTRYQLSWGMRIGDDSAIGAGVQFGKSQIRHDLGPMDISKSNSESYAFRLGTLNRIDGPLLGGAVAEYSFTRDRTTMFAIPLFGTPEVRTQDTTHELALRPGLSYEYATDSMVLLDYQIGSYFNHEGSIIVHRFHTGVDHRVFDWLFLRAGVAMDTRAHTALTCGLGIYPGDRFTIDIAYQRDMFPEVREEFGRSDTLILSLAVSF